jgi:hypothetical protein
LDFRFESLLDMAVLDRAQVESVQGTGSACRIASGSGISHEIPCT